MRLLLFRQAVFHPEPIVMISSICIKQCFVLAQCL